METLTKETEVSQTWEDREGVRLEVKTTVQSLNMMFSMNISCWEKMLTVLWGGRAPCETHVTVVLFFFFFLYIVVVEDYCYFLLYNFLY